MFTRPLYRRCKGMLRPLGCACIIVFVFVVPTSERSIPLLPPLPTLEGIIRYYASTRLSTRVEAHWLRSHRGWIRLYRIIRASVVVVHV